MKWRHAEANRDAWLEKHDSEEAKVCTARNVASAVGILLWNIRVSGEPLATLSEVITTMSDVGRRMASSRDWDDIVDVQNFEELKNEVRQIARDDSWKTRVVVSDSFVPTKTYFVAADASGKQGAYVIMFPGPVLKVETFIVKFEGDDDLRSINWKETKTAIEAVKRICDREQSMDGVEIRIAEDNTTAVTAINAFFYHRDAAMCAELLDLLGRMKGGRIVMSYYNTKLQPADEPSRGQPVDLEKCRKCLAFLSLSRGKRSREDVDM